MAIDWQQDADLYGGMDSSAIQTTISLPLSDMDSDMDWIRSGFSIEVPAYVMNDWECVECSAYLDCEEHHTA